MKIKRSSIVYLVTIAAVVIPFVLVFDQNTASTASPVNGWDNFYREGFSVFVFLLFPFFYILTATLLIQIESRNNTWKQIIASPQSTFQLLLAKYAVLQVVAIIFMIVFNLYMMVACILIDLIYDINFLEYLEQWPRLLFINFKAWISTMGVSALSFWLALRFKNFIAPVAIGLLLWLIGPTAALELKWPHFDKYVFVLPFMILSKTAGHNYLFYELLSVVYANCFFAISYFEFQVRK